MKSSPKLPIDLLEAENHFSKIILQDLELIESKRLAINLKFEGLRLMPIILRLGVLLHDNDYNFKILWSDAGSVALARRDNPDLKDYIFSFGDVISGKCNPNKDQLIIAVSPQPYDYDDFLKVCKSHSGKIIMFNGRLEDTAVGIGSIGRERRKEFISSWSFLYSLEPISQGALMIKYPDNWNLFRLDQDGYRFVKSFATKPDIDTVAEHLIA